MTSETINGLHSCKPGNEPTKGETKLFVIEQRTSKSGKPYIKIKSAGQDYGGQPYRILSAKPTDFTDSHGNISFNLEIESCVQKGDGERSSGEANISHAARHDPSPTLSNGVDETRQHIMQSANLYVLCVNAVNNYVATHLPEVVQTSEQFQAAVGTLFIEASHKRTNDGVNWWSYVDRMPVTPIK